MSEITLQYPVPRQPSYVENPTVDELMPFARKAVERTGGRGPLGQVKPGDKALLVVPPGQEEAVLDAIIQAFKEKGIEAESVGDYELQGLALEQLQTESAAEGWKEITHFLASKEATRILGIEEPIYIDAKPYLKGFLERNPQYTAVYAGLGGNWEVFLGEQAWKYKGPWLYETHEELMSKLDEMPGEALSLIDLKIVGLFDRIAEVRITDPEGTDLHFSVTPEEGKVWAAKGLITGHLLMSPQMASMILADEKGDLGLIIRPMGEGVIAGASNHYGFFPHMKTYFKEGMVYRIEGGGKFGDLLRELLEKTRDVHYPGFPRPGYLCLYEAALGTNPKMYRRRADLFGSFNRLPNTPERNRSGVIHWGMGVDSAHPEIVKFAAEHKVPKSHVGHAAHTYFNTYEARMRDTGEWMKIIDKGRITILDDPEVRKVAAKYGDPDELLKEEWFPAIPGINYPGDYMRDYGQNPASWVKKEVEGQLPATIGVPK